jgi:putative ABC transport system permease protein
VQLDGRPVVVAGILSPTFEPPEAITGSVVDIWLPLDVEAEESLGWHVLGVVGKLNKDVEFTAAQAEIDALTEGLAAEMPGVLVRQDGSLRYTRLVPLHIATTRGVALVLVMLFVAVGLLLLIACANVANLLLARGTTRAREIALRGALGAGRSRIVRQLLTESVCLGVLGGLLGVALAYAGVAGFVHFNPGGVPRIHHVAVDTRVLSFALLAAMGTGVLFGLFPVVQAVRKNVSEALAETASSTTPTRRGRFVRSGLVVTEIALALMLLTGAGLFFRSMVAMTRVEPGFESAQLVTVPLSLGPRYTPAERGQFAEDIFRRIRAIPGTEEVAAGMTVPFEFTGSSKCCIWNQVRSEMATNHTETLPWVMIQPITPDYFATLGTPVAYGREFVSGDVSEDRQVVIINTPLARYFFGEEDAVGRSIHLESRGPYTVVGVVPGIHHWGVTQGTPPGVYVPYAQVADRLHLLVRSRADAQTLVPALRAAVASLDPSLPVAEIIPMRHRVSASLAGERFLSFLLGSFAVVALILAAGGIYASMLYMVGQRRAEMGIRSALGATRMNLTALVLKNGLFVTAIGVAIGLAGSIAASRFLGNVVWGLSAIAPTTIGGVAGILATIALSACVIPARRAARADPLRILKSQ